MNKEYEEKVEKLRSEREKDRVAKNATIASNTHRAALRKMKTGDAVSVTIKSMSFSGYISAVRTKNGEEVYDVSSVNGELTGIKRSQLKWRYVEDLSNVKIPAELKKLNTRHLLSLLSEARVNRYEKADYHGKNFSIRQLKAELKLREHMPSKRERRAFPKKG
jgi:hypothetical protein